MVRTSQMSTEERTKEGPSDLFREGGAFRSLAAGIIVREK